MKKNRILYLSLLFLSIVFVYFYGGKLPYTILYISLLLPFISFIYTFIVYARFKYSEEIEKKFITKGDNVKFLVTVDNEDLLFYPYITVTFWGTETIFAKQLETTSFSLMPFETKSFSVNLECKYRGCYSIGIQSIVIKDFLGILRLNYKGFETKRITVFPKIVRLNRFNLKTNLISESHSVLNSMFKDNTSISDVRQYQYGDAFKNIHWKLTAKLDEIMVKNMESTLMTSAAIILDLEKSSSSPEINTIIEDKVIEAVVAVLNYCLGNWVNVNLVYYYDKIIDIEGKNPLDFKRMFDILAGIRFNNHADISDVLKLYLGHNTNRSNIIIFTPNPDYDLIGEIYKTKYSNYEVTLIYISPEQITGSKNHEAENILGFLPEIGVDSYKINLNDNIRQVLER